MTTTPSDVLAIVMDRSRRVTRREVADAYRELLRECWRTRVWPPVVELNEAIAARWSLAGLEWIKREAWKP